MKFLVASDIHGSAYYAEKCVEAFKREGADKLILLGDILYHGPRNPLPRDYAPQRVAELLNSVARKIICVRGNCDSEVDQMVLEFPVLIDSAVLVIGEKTVLVQHGDKLDDYLTDGFDAVLFGHVHVPVCERRGGSLWLNPGSAALPKDGTSCGYMLIDGDEIVWKSFDGETFMSARF